MYTTKVILFLTALFIVGCDSTSPPPNGGDEKKEFIWSDEKIPGGEAVVPTGMWGNSPNDIWVVGWKESWKGIIFHYDGTKWKDVTPGLGLADIYNCIYGFGSDNIYVGGYKWFILDDKMFLSAIILHYDGAGWVVEVDNIKNNGTINSIHGNNPNNIWAGGENGTIYHYNGLVWQRKTYPDTMHTKSMFCLIDGQTLFINEYNNYPVNDGWKMLYFTEYNENGWVHIDSCKLIKEGSAFTGYKFGHKAVWGETKADLFTAGVAVFRQNFPDWERIAWREYPLQDIKGTDKNNVFAVGEHGTILYSNGENWTQITDFSTETVDFFSVMPFEKSVFILGYYQRDIYSIIGKLKE